MSALTLTILRSRVSGSIGLSNVAASAEQVLIDGWINEGRDQLLIDTSIRVKRTNAIALVAGTQDYNIVEDLALSALKIKALILTSTVAGVSLEPLEQKDPYEVLMHRRYPGASRIVGYAVDGANYLMLDGTVNTGDTIDAIYVPTVTDMSSGSHDPSNVTYGGIPATAHPAIEAYAKWKAADYDDDTSSQIGLAYKAEYEEWVKKINRRSNRFGGKLPPARLKRRNTPLPPVSPGTDRGD